MIDGGFIVRHSKRFTTGLLVAGLVAGSISIGGCGTNYASPKNDDKALAVTIGEEKIYLDEIKPYIFFEEVSGHYMGYIYASYGISSTYWEDASYDDEDKNNSQQAKENAINTAIDNIILYKCAMDKGGYEVDDSITEQFKTNAKNLIECMSKDTLRKSGFTEEDFVNYQTKKYIAGKYKEDLIEEFGITKEQFEKDYDYDKEYRAYETSFIRVALKTQDEEGNEIDIPDSTRTELEEKMELIKKSVDNGESFSDAIKDYTEQYGITSSTKTFTIGDYKEIVGIKDDESEDGKEEDNKDADKDSTTADSSEDKDTDSQDAQNEDDTQSTEDAHNEEDEELAATENPDAEYIKTMIKMKVDEVTDVFEADGYLYIAKVTDNDSKSAYDSALENAVSEQEQKEYDEWLENCKSDKYSYTINEEVWDTIDLRDLTVVEDEFLKTFGMLENPANKDK